MPAPELLLGSKRFDLFEIDLRAGELRKEGRRIKLQDQPFRVLAFLLECPGEIVTRDELRQRLWPADTFVDFDHGLNSAVARLREALQDSADNSRFIETIAKRGYRFIAHIKEIPPATAPPKLEKEVPAALPIPDSRLRKIRGAAAIFSILVCAGAVLAFVRRKPEPPLSLMEVVPLGLRGFQATPAFSPDGSLIAYRQTDGSHNDGIYTALVGGERPLQITANSGDCCPTWSQDGRQIAFSRYSERGFLSLYTVPALGGVEHRIYRGPTSIGAGLSWSPDGKFLVFAEGTTGDATSARLALLALADSTVRPFTAPPSGWLDHEPTFSPDGTQIAFVRSTAAGVSNDVFVVPTSGGEPRRLTFDNLPIMGPPTWTADSREIVFSSNRGATTSLWRIAFTGGVPRPVPGAVGGAKWPSLARKGGTLLYEAAISQSNISKIDLKSARHFETRPSAVISEKGDKARPDYSLDGRKIAFESNRSGFWEIWICNADGSDCNPLTSLRGTAGRPRWSPNGRYLAFEFHPHERSEIYLVEVPGGTPHLLPTIAGADNLSPSWSRDGKWLYFASKRGGEPFQIWKMPTEGGAPTMVTVNAGIGAAESPDGRYLYYSKYEKGGLWRMPLQGGEESEVLNLEGESWPNWALTTGGIYFLCFDQFPSVTLDFFDLATRQITPIWTFQNKPGWGVSLSNDGKSLVFVQDEFAQSNIMLVSNFH